MIYARFLPDQFYPFLRLFLIWRFDVVVAFRRKETEDMFRFALGIALARDGCEVREVYLVSQFGAVSIFVN